MFLQGFETRTSERDGAANMTAFTLLYNSPNNDSTCFYLLQDPDFAEVLTDLNSRELFWLSRGQLEIAVATEGRDPRQISGFITSRKSCDSKWGWGLLRMWCAVVRVVVFVGPPVAVFVIFLYKDHFFSLFAWALSSLIASGEACL